MVHRSLELANALREAGGTVVFVRVLVNELLPGDADAPLSRPATAPPPSASEFAPEVQRQIQEGNVIVAKRQWGAFHATALDQALRRRSVRTLVFAGIATNFGVESTARAAMDLGYGLIFAEDAMSSVSEEMHWFAVQTLFPEDRPRAPHSRTCRLVPAVTGHGPPGFGALTLTVCRPRFCHVFKRVRQWGLPVPAPAGEMPAVPDGPRR